MLAACGASDDEPSASTAASGASGAFPARIEGAFGTATVPAAPKRVVALGWSDQDVLLGLGVKPVAVYDIGPDFPTGVGPWASDLLDGQKPQKLSLADGIPFEKVAALRPDLIVAVQSGVTADDYAKLAKIAPTVTYAKGRAPYVTPWPEQAEIIGEAVGQPEKAAQLVQTTKDALAQARKDHPDLQGRTFTYMARRQGDQVGLYLPDDLRLKFLEDLGMKLSPGQRAAARSAPKGAYFVDVSYERLGALDADVLVAWFTSESERKAFSARPVFRAMDVAKRGGFVPLDLIQAQAQGAPTVLSIPWAIDNVVPLVERGLAGKGPRS
nr:iron-siderophore ABC transporter substrate-binding protein [Patulibacter sp. SYSU D01012]